MSRIGKKPIPIPEGVQIDLKDDLLLVKGPKGQLQRKLHPKVKIDTVDSQIVVSTVEEDRESKAFQGLFRSLISNMVHGVSQGFEKSLEIVGVGYRAELSGRTATFHLGYSHPIHFDLPDGIDAQIDRTRVTLMGIDKELLGQTAATIRGFRKPEPYKGKGVKYVDEVIKRKAGKTGAK
jgi:large subunit ribosomal protein L6